MSFGLALLAPHRTVAGFEMPSALVIIVLVIAVLGGLAIFGYRSPDRPPGADTKAERDRIED